jgi:hypothetical protein
MEIKRKNSSTPVQHIDTIIADIQDHIDKKQDFVGFILVSLGIEFIGSFFDAKDFNDHGLSDKRFKNGLSLFKKNWYQQNKDFLFKQLRGPLIHQYRTGTKVSLTSACKNDADLTLHLKSDNGKTIFVLEQLFADFKEACEKLKIQVNKPNSFNSEKLNKEYLTVYEIGGIKTVFLSTTQSHITETIYASGNVDVPKSTRFIITTHLRKRKERSDQLCVAYNH